MSYASPPPFDLSDGLAELAHDAIGSVGFFHVKYPSSNFLLEYREGDTLSGSDLRYGGVAVNTSNTSEAGSAAWANAEMTQVNGASPPGTWVCLGQANTVHADRGSGPKLGATTWRRVA